MRQHALGQRTTDQRIQTMSAMGGHHDQIAMLALSNVHNGLLHAFGDHELPIKRHSSRHSLVGKPFKHLPSMRLAMRLMPLRRAISVLEVRGWPAAGDLDGKEREIHKTKTC